MKDIIKEPTSQRWRQKINHLLDAMDRVAGATDKREILQTAAIKMASLLDGETAIVSSWDSIRQQIAGEAFHTSGTWRPPRAWYPPRTAAQHPLFQQVLTQQHSAQFQLSSNAIPASIRREMETTGLKTWAAFPLLGMGRSLLGMIEVLDSREERELRTEEMALGELLSKWVSTTYERALLVERSQEKSRQLDSLLALIAGISPDTGLPKALDKIAMALAEISRSEFCLIYTCDLETNRLELLAHTALHPDQQLVDVYFPRQLDDYPFYLDVIEDQAPRQLLSDDPLLHPLAKAYLKATDSVSLLAIPMLREGGQCIGMIELLHRGMARIFDSQEMEMMRVLAGHIARAISQTRVQDAQQQERRFSVAMVEASKALNSSLNLSDVLEKILEQTMAVMNCQTANVMLIEGESARVVEYIGYEGKPESVRLILNKSLPLTNPTLKRMLETKKPVIVPNTEEVPDWVVLEGNDWMRSYAGAPLLVAGDVIGFLNLDSEHPDFFLTSDTTPLEAFASIAASVLRNAQRYNSVQERASELEIVRKATLSLTASLDLADVLTTILKQSLDLFNGPRDGHIFLYSDGRLQFGTAMRGDGSSDEIWAEPREDGLTYTVARTGLPIIVDDMRKHPLFRNTPENWTGSIIGLPLKYSGDVVGVMNIAHLVSYQFKDHEIRVLSLLADQAAISIVNARLHHLVQEQSLTDPLTGLHNRRSFTQRLEEEVHRSQRYDRSFSLAIMDLNGFKKVNDTFGHPAGDHVLIRISRCLRESVRNTDFLARYGGDEFALIMPETLEGTARQLTLRLHDALRDCDYGLSGKTVLPITVSIGIAQFPEDAMTGESLIAAADRDLYSAKSNWRKAEG